MQNRSASPDRRDSSPSIRAIILDYGKVLARSPDREEFGRMAEMFDVPFAEFYALWETTRDSYDRGDVTPEEYWLQLAARTNSSIDGSQIKKLRAIEIEVWAHIDPGMIDWVCRLRAAGVKTGLLSNMPRDLVRHLRANFGWMEDFVFKTFSSEVKLIKPDAAIYEHTLRGLKVSATEALFVDDREINIEAARRLGMHAILFRSVAQLKHELEALAFPILPAVGAGAAGPSREDANFSALL